METLVGSIPEPEPTPPTYAEQAEAYRTSHKAALTHVAKVLNAPAKTASTAFKNAIN